MDDYLAVIGLETRRRRPGLARPRLHIDDVEAFLDFAERTYRDRYPCLTGLTARHGC